MKTIEYRYVNKTDWPAGPWMDEPDKIQFADPETGLPCLIVRGPLGALCGYVGVSEGHPLHGVSYTAEDNNISVHGGLTFSDRCAEHEHGICHIPDEGEPESVWWLGFDCAHGMDVIPALGLNLPEELRFRLSDLELRATYKTVFYVKRECARLAKQLARDNE